MRKEGADREWWAEDEETEDAGRADDEEVRSCGEPEEGDAEVCPGCDAPPEEEGGAAEGGRQSRRKRPVRARTVAIKQIRKEELRLGALLYPERDYYRPRTRGECRCEERPCPYVGCKYHLYLDVSASGGIKFNFPDLEVWELEETCALDVAERSGGVTLEEVGVIMNLTRERIRQLEAVGIGRLADAGLLEMMEGQMAGRVVSAPAPAPASRPVARPRPPRRAVETPPALPALPVGTQAELFHQAPAAAVAAVAGDDELPRLERAAGQGGG